MVFVWACEVDVYVKMNCSIYESVKWYLFGPVKWMFMFST